MNDPEVIALGTLNEKRVALSASESADLGRLGLSEYHCRLVIAEVGRALMLAGATVVYGGNLSADGYTDILLEEAQRFGGSRQLLELTIPESEYTKHTVSELNKIDGRLGEHGKLVLIRSDSVVVQIRDAVTTSSTRVDLSQSLSAMRAYTSTNTDARVVVGGKLTDYQGRLPGVIEEALLTAEAGKTLLVAGGFGGAATVISNALNSEATQGWQPPNFPVHAHSATMEAALGRLKTSRPYVGSEDEYADRLRKVLAVSHRPADISTSVIRLLAASFEES
ncbi:hypothetical protein [Subtercola vilae]|uniref:hypothetical protein n=1 Tax=Subtercola vilae TaxID=2056433 RepID=UPI0010AA4A87|nr:hypothetical protein [Subtercola vilae]